MIIKYDDLSEREVYVYTFGYIIGLCHNCKKREKHDDYNKLPSKQKYCLKCKTKQTIDFLLYSKNINLTDLEK